MALSRILRNLWHDESDARRAVPRDVALRLRDRVAASERRHTGEIRICVEGGLPLSWLLRRATVRARALAMFGKLGVWNTEHDNGVLIYFLLAERAIEIVADRGIARHVAPHEWQAMVGRMGAAFAAGRFEDGLTQALEEVSALLVAHFPARDGDAAPGNELTDEPELR